MAFPTTIDQSPTVYTVDSNSVTQTSSNILSTDTTIPVVSPNKMYYAGYAVLGDSTFVGTYEVVKYSSIVSGNLVGVVRNIAGTNQAWTAPATVTNASAGTGAGTIPGLTQADYNIEVSLGTGTPVKTAASNTFTVGPQILGQGVLLIESDSTSLTAAGNSQGTALQLTNEINRCTTVAAGTGVILPVAAAGLTIIIVNHGANPLQVYGNGNDTVDDVTNTVGVTQMVNSTCIYICTDPGQWYSNGLGSGYAGSLQTFSYTDGMSANSGGVQSGATAITTSFARFTTVGGAGYSALLPTAVAGLDITVINAGANTMAVFPAGADQINTLPASAAFQLQPGGVVTFYSTVTTKWHTIASQNATITGSTPANPTGTTSTTQVMAGLARSLTPNATTRAMVVVTGLATQTTGNGTTAQIRFGTGTAPTNGAAATGTTAGNPVTITALTGVLTQAFALSAIVTGLTIGTAYWFDLGEAAVTGGTATLTNLTYNVIEV